jgi:hypothetical protein
MVVVPLSRARRKECIGVLRHFLTRAQEEGADGVLVAVRFGGAMTIAVAGDYKTDPAHGVNAAMRALWRLTQLQEDRDLGC